MRPTNVASRVAALVRGGPVGPASLPTPGAMTTYPELGASREGPLPPGYHHVVRAQRLGSGRAVFRAAADALARWQPQRGAGLLVRTDAARVAPGVRFSSGIGFGSLRLWVPCEVVWVVDEPDRYGFGFGTLAGHIETGEEAFVVSIASAGGGKGVDTRGDEGDVWFDIRAFSRPANWWVKLGNPVAKVVQALVTDRYVRAMLPRERG